MLHFDIDYDMLTMLHKSNMRSSSRECIFVFRQKRILYFGILLRGSRICVATNGAMRFSVCGSIWSYTLFYFTEVERNEKNIY